MCMYDWQVSRDTCQEPEPADADDADDADAKALSPAICVVHLPRWVLWCGSRTAPCSQENLCIAEIMTQLQKVKQKHHLFSAQVSNICI